ncbi:hypothetical protein IMZ48_16305 [Candidatus Bathyarchaeota archaeon]|nr:hypothetical protein [Candidatus Bathyarchaeota archaeon]
MTTPWRDNLARHLRNKHRDIHRGLPGLKLKLRESGSSLFVGSLEAGG